MPDKEVYIFFVVSIVLLFLSGCTYDDEPMPQITRDYNTESSVLGGDNYSSSNGSMTNTLQGIPAEWIPPTHLEKHWTAIIIHHSATDNGNARIFDRWHREGNHWDSIGYDFVIGNGSDSGDGKVETTVRWRRQKTGAHCGGTNNNWANKDGVGICLVGNFNKYRPTHSQIHSLVRLVNFLKNRYGINKNHIYGHRDTPGAHQTDCPGRLFPMYRFKSLLD